MSHESGSGYPSADLSDLKATVVLPSSGHLLSAGERSDLIDQAYDEFCERVHAGEDVDIDEFCARYPDIRTSVRKLVQCHRKLEALPDRFAEMAVQWPTPGDEFVGYRLISELGRGAFARVFLAQELDIGGRLVALKVSMHDDQEADTLGRVEHANVVPIYSTKYDMPTKLNVVVMPFLGGTTLSHIIDQVEAEKSLPQSAGELLAAARDSRWRPERTSAPAPVYRDGRYVDGVAYVAERLADALDHIHRQGVVHRDLKPSNVLLAPNGEPMLLDFNLAMDQDTHEYRLGGTLPYMPPEQLRALERRQGSREIGADVRTDLYGLGVILFELLTGEHPFGPMPTKLSTHEVRSFLIDKHRSGPRPIRSLNPDVDVRLAKLIECCLANDPKDRPKSAAELCRSLRSLQTPARRAVRWVAAHRKVLAAAAVAGIMLAGGASAYVATLPPASQREAAVGDEHARAGRLVQAVAAYSRSLDANPNQPEVRFARGRAYLLSPTSNKRDFNDNLSHAILDFVESDPEGIDGRTLACRAFCHGALDQHETAIELNRQAIEAGFENPAVLSNRAYSENARGLHFEAVATASRALTFDPDHAGALINRAIARFHLSEEYGARYLTLGFEDARRGLSRSMGSAKTYYVVASIGARALQMQSKSPDADLEKQVIEFTRMAVQRGYPRAEIEHCPLLGKWARQMSVEVTDLPNPNAAIDERLLDPMS